MKTQTLPIFPDFKPFELKDRDIIIGFTDEYNIQSCEYNFANLFCWQDTYKLVWSIYQERLIIYDGIEQSFLMPVGKPIPPEELFILSTFMETQISAPNISAVPPEYIEAFPEISGYYSIKTERKHADYLYSVHKLVDLKGKKLQKKKNLISQFKKQFPDYSVKPITGDLVMKTHECARRLFLDRKETSDTLKEEYQALTRAFEFFNRLRLEGLVLLVDDRPVAFSIFSRLNSTTYDIHFEKSDLTIKGAAQMINHETAKFLENKCEYINREQDLGIPGLRQAKLSYDPDDILVNSTLAFSTSLQEGV